MEGSRQFNRLVSELSLDERAKMLEKLNTQTDFANTTLYDENSQEAPVEQLEVRYQKLPWYYKFWFFILSFFKSRSPLKLFEEQLMLKMSIKIEEKAPGLYQYQNDLLLAGFQEELIKLRDGSRFFYSTLDSSFNRDRGGLMVFLGSLEMPEIHKQIVENTDPQGLSAKYPELNEVELRQKALQTLENAFAGIGEEQRGVMYANTRSLYCLKQLSSFLYDRIINAFVFNSALQKNTCPAPPVRDQLSALNNILFSMKWVPSVTLLESLFVYVLMENSGDSGFDMQSEMRKLLVRAGSSLKIIKDFNYRVPLTALLRCSAKNMGLSPKLIGGGEDWFAVYREHWKAQIEDLFTAFARTRRQRDLQDSFNDFFKGTELRMLENMGSESNPAGLPVKGNYSLSFLQTFYAVVFLEDINRIIRPILIDGEFHRRENRAEFTEYYNNLIRLDDLIKHYDGNISPAGDYGLRYAQAKADMSSLPVKRRKIQIVLEEAAKDAEKIIGQTREAMEGMAGILGGIIGKGTDEKYGTLANLSNIAKGKSQIDAIEGCIEQLSDGIRLLDEIDALEAGR
ncbi:MAG: DUF5312 domain-containing protein [Treponema sp.]|jgi:hypothetical protein|nr:DUF5312 domain-containing protein [Treponema sp.]